MATAQSPLETPAVACLACRNRHSRCDAGRPRCARCTKDNRECVYVASRRGYRGPNRPSRIPGPPSEQHIPSNISSIDSSSPSPQSVHRHAFTPPTSIDSDGRSYLSRSLSSTPPKSEEQRHIDLFYRYFYRSHPFLLPQHLLHLRPMQSCLHDVVVLVGASLCVEHHGYDFGPIKVKLDLCDEQQVEIVQARLILSILLHAHGKSKCALDHLTKAIELALQLNMHHEWLAASQGNPILAESCRRTWWELFSADAFLAGFHHQPTFQTNMVSADTLLPCEDSAYISGIPKASNLSYQHLRRRAFLDEDKFSSYALRIEAVGILGRVLAANDPDVTTDLDSFRGLDGLLSTWTTSLPDSKMDIIGIDGSCDELIFQAQMIALMAAIYLHLPRSGIFSFRSSSDVACAKANEQATPFLSLNSHANKAMTAAKQLSTLASLDVAERRRTPFFICSLVLISIVHLSAVAAQPDDAPEWQTDRISQALGLLKAESRTWPLAANAHAQLRKVASAAARPSSIMQPIPDFDQVPALDFDALMSEMWWSDAISCPWNQTALGSAQG
ncbi:hypothetical protein KVT40_009299 [Elsinoe batatas]|uniref:Zn(2)-C6 fungal-type domain-containing protein n=1 Tax=Elsinoe batatas TaxID=2601811 RepID=A0A8K0KUC1_9PEZI|nr:hypothetical protein KVT40_009299 [Elsinoe batatas]